MTAVKEWKMANYRESSVRWHAVPLFHMSLSRHGTIKLNVVPECLYRADNANFIDVYASLAQAGMRIFDDSFAPGATKLVSAGFTTPSVRLEDEELYELLQY